MISRKGFQEGRRVACKAFAWWHGRNPDFVGWTDRDQEAERRRVFGSYRKTKSPCSCPACGSPRRYRKGKERLTMAERRAREAARQDMAGEV